MITEKAPGKLFLAGEYAITNTGQTSIIFAVDRYITVTLTPTTDSVLTLKNSTYEDFSCTIEDLDNIDLSSDWALCLRTCQIMKEIFTQENITFTGYQVEITSDLTQNNRKLGLGSSAALVIALLRAFLKAGNLVMNNPRLFKLGVLVTITTPPFNGGSMGDIAAAVYGGTIHYRKFDGAWLKEEIMHTDLLSLLDVDWPDMGIDQIEFPDSWQLLVGWTGQPANTQDMLAVNQEFARIYREKLASKSTPLVDKLAAAISSADYLRVSTLLQLNQEALKHYASFMHLNYLTDRLHMLLVIAHKFGAAAKISGAGGGDNGIAIVKDAEKTEKIRCAWEKHDITPLQLNIAPERGID